MTASTTLGRTPDGRRLLVGREIPAPAETVWSLLIDTAHWPDWGPTTRAVELDETPEVNHMDAGEEGDEATDASTRIHAGTTGRVRVAGVWIPFTVTTCADYRWTWSVARIPATGHRVESLGRDRCRATFEVPVLAAGYVPVCRVALRRLERLALADS